LDDPSNTAVGTREDLLLAARRGADIPDNATRRERRQAEREIRSELALDIAQGNVVVVESDAERELAVEHATATREIRNREQTHAGIMEARTIIESGSDGDRGTAIDRLDAMIEEVGGIEEITTIETSSGQSVVLGEGGEEFLSGLEIERDRLQYQINVEQFDEQAVLTELQTQLAGDIDAERAEAYRNITILQEELHRQRDLLAYIPDDPLEETARRAAVEHAHEFTATEIDFATRVLAGEVPNFTYFPYDETPDAEQRDVYAAMRAIEAEMPQVEDQLAGQRSATASAIERLESTIAEEQAIIDRTSGEGLNAEIERRLPAALADARPIEPDTSVTTYFEEGRVLGQTLEEASQQLREYTGQETLHDDQEAQLRDLFEEQQALLQAANPEPILNTDQFGNLTQIVDHDFFPEQERKPVPQDDFKTNLPFQRYENIESFVQQLDEGTFDSEGYTNLTDTQFILGDEGHERQPTTFLSEMKKVTLDIQDRASLRSGGMTLEEVVGMLIAQAPELRRLDKVTENMANEIASILARTFFKDSAYVSSFSFSENSLQKAIFNVIRTS
jgi:hypothetical protein